jgi:predicted regulator of Ras-like GTPase activity (Roadblock/LC7/MglB family)
MAARCVPRSAKNFEKTSRIVREASLSPVTDGKKALDELTEISSQIESAVLFGADGEVVASTLPDLHAKQVASSAKALFEEAGRASTGELTHLEAITGDGSLFVVREGDLLVAAATGEEPTAGLVFYDLKACLRKAAEKPKAKAAKAKPKPRAAAKPKPKTTRSRSNGKS